MVIEARKGDYNSRSKAAGGISEDINNTGEELERDHDEERMDGTAFASTKSELCRLTSEINGVRERSEGGEADWNGAVDKGHVGEGEGSEVQGLF